MKYAQEFAIWLNFQKVQESLENIDLKWKSSIIPAILCDFSIMKITFTMILKLNFPLLKIPQAFIKYNKILRAFTHKIVGEKRKFYSFCSFHPTLPLPYLNLLWVKHWSTVKCENFYNLKRRSAGYKYCKNFQELLLKSLFQKQVRKSLSDTL